MGALSVPQAAADQSPYVEVGVASQLHPGQRTSGDRHIVVPRDDGVLVAVVDGVGHGEEAAAAAELAVSTIERFRNESVIALARRCHAALVGTRGVAMSMARFGVVDDTMTWLAIGNVEGVLVRADAAMGSAREAIIMRGGVVGSRLPPLQATMVGIGRDDLLVFATDGVRAGFEGHSDPARAPQQVANAILGGYAKGTDDALVLAVRYLGRRGAEAP